MTTHKINNREYLFLEVPEGAYNFRKSHNGRNVYEKWVKFDTDTDAIDGKVIISNTPIDYTILRLASELTEEQAKELVDKFTLLPTTENEGYKNYLTYAKGFKTAIESLHSLITSLGLTPERTLIIERKK